MTTPTLGQPVLLRTASTRTSPALISKIIDGTTVNLDAFIDTADDWPVTMIPVTHPCQLYENVELGTGVGQWQPAPVPEQVTDAIDTAVAGVDTSGLQVVAAAGVSQLSLGLNAARQPSSTRPTRVTATGTIALTSTLIAPQSAAVKLLSDNASTPTTSRGEQQASLSGVAASVTMPWSLTYDVPAGHYYSLSTSGAGTVALLTINETAA